jgi:L-fuconolactonase
MALRIDSHHHLWDLGEAFDYRWLDDPALAAIRRDFLPADLEPLIRSAKIDKTVVVQTQHTVKENDWALAIAESHDWIAGIVGWVDLASSDCESQLVEAVRHPKFVGVRHVTQDEPDNDFIVSEPVLRGLKVLQTYRVPFDLLFFVKHLHHVPALAAQVPELPMVIDHLAKPRIRERITDDWIGHFRAAAAFPHVYCKLSGMITEADWKTWKPADLKPYVQAALDLFGADRLMFGSDWPVCNLAGSYSELIDALEEALGPISTTEREMIFGGTAARFYSLETSTSKTDWSPVPTAS